MRDETKFTINNLYNNNFILCYNWYKDKEEEFWTDITGEVNNYRGWKFDVIMIGDNYSQDFIDFTLKPMLNENGKLFIAKTRLQCETIN